MSIQKNIRITYMDIWLDGLNHDSFKQSTETRLFHRDETSKKIKYN